MPENKDVEYSLFSHVVGSAKLKVGQIVPAGQVCPARLTFAHPHGPKCSEHHSVSVRLVVVKGPDGWRLLRPSDAFRETADQ